jgi:hypothetical protein
MADDAQAQARLRIERMAGPEGRPPMQTTFNGVSRDRADPRLPAHSATDMNYTKFPRFRVSHEVPPSADGTRTWPEFDRPCSGRSQAASRPGSRFPPPCGAREKIECSIPATNHSMEMPFHIFMLTPRRPLSSAQQASMDLLSTTSTQCHCWRRIKR